MRKLLVFAVAAAAAWGLSNRHHETTPIPESFESEPQPRERSLPESALPAPRASFSCDSRIYCSQMTSCDEAKYFLQHCPNTKMDGDRDGVPCEQQWCPNE